MSSIMHHKDYVIISNYFSMYPKYMRTLLLLGLTGTGKSSTGNTIIGQNKFNTAVGLDYVTKSCELHSKEANGVTVNVIDTPGFYNVDIGIENLAQEFMNCLSMVKDGISAVLLVLSIRYPFTNEELSAVACLERIYGPKMYDYLVVVFTNGDKLDKNETLDSIISKQEPLLDLLQKCGYRKVLFDNMSPVRRDEQLEKLLALVEQVVDTTAGRPFIDQVSASLKVTGHLTVKEAAYAVLKEKLQCPKDEHPSREIQESKEATYADVAANEMERAGSPSQEINSDLAGDKTVDINNKDLTSADAVLKEQVQWKSDQPADLAADNSVEINNKDLISVAVSKEQVQGKSDQPADLAADETLEINSKDLTLDKLIRGVESGSGGELKVIEKGMKKMMKIYAVKRNLNEAAKKGLADLLSFNQE